MTTQVQTIKKEVPAYKIPKQLLSVSKDAKTSKGESLGWTTGVLYLPPADKSGRNFCPFASEGCKAACLAGSGNFGMFKNVEKAVMNRGNFLNADRQKFIKLVNVDILKLDIFYDKVAIRLNGTSDLRVEYWKLGKQNLFEIHPHIQFYDYTKNPHRMRNNKWSNYHLTFSMSETNQEDCWQLLKEGYNVAAVFDVKKGQPLPETYRGYKVIDGDKHDLRFLDESNVIVGLRYKQMTGKGVNNEEIKKDNDFIIKDF